MIVIRIISATGRLKNKIDFSEAIEVHNAILNLLQWIDPEIIDFININSLYIIIKNLICLLNSEFIFNYKVPEGMYPGMYTAVAKTVNGNSDIIIESKFITTTLAATNVDGLYGMALNPFTTEMFVVYGIDGISSNDGRFSYKKQRST